jgi:hypothetical protein
MLIAGGIGIGLVAGWLAGRLLGRARWSVRIWVLLGLITQGVLVLRIASLPAALWFGVAALAAALICFAWVRALERRRLEAEYPIKSG